jgi:uncharacterized membrane protein YhhN
MGMNFGPLFWALAGLGVAAAAAYGLFFLNRPHSLLRASVKTLFMGALTSAFVVAGAPFPLLVALAASALGDFFLANDRKWLLPFGILSFLIAQLAYLIIFFGLWIFSGDNSPLWPRYVAMGAIIATTIGFLIWMAPELKWMALGVLPYSIAIAAMAVQAMWLPWPGWPAMLGALLFLTSDLVLATELFRLPADAPVRRITAPVVWWTYAAAQVLIVTGILAVVFS